MDLQQHPSNHSSKHLFFNAAFNTICEAYHRHCCRNALHAGEAILHDV